jgi:hypothetical protein
MKMKNKINFNKMELKNKIFKKISICKMDLLIYHIIIKKRMFTKIHIKIILLNQEIQKNKLLLMISRKIMIKFTLMINLHYKHHQRI